MTLAETLVNRLRPGATTPVSWCLTRIFARYLGAVLSKSTGHEFTSVSKLSINSASKIGYPLTTQTKIHAPYGTNGYIKLGTSVPNPFHRNPELAGLIDKVFCDTRSGVGNEALGHRGEQCIVALEWCCLVVGFPIGSENNLCDTAFIGTRSAKALWRGAVDVGYAALAVARE